MRMKTGLRLACGPSAFVAALSSTAGAAPPTIVRVPVHSRVGGGADFSLEAFVYRPATKGKHPLVLLSHGSSGDNPKMELPQQELAQFFTNRGFVVVAAMRRGRGKSGGVSLESEEKDCDPRSWKQGLAAAFEDVTAALDFAGKMPDVDARTVLLVGESGADSCPLLMPPTAHDEYASEVSSTSSAAGWPRRRTGAPPISTRSALGATAPRLGFPSYGSTGTTILSTQHLPSATISGLSSAGAGS